MDQFVKSLDVMRSACQPKFPNLPNEVLDDFRTGKTPDVIPKDLKCYVRCIYQMSGTLGKKGELSLQKYLAQIPSIVPKELQEKFKDGMKKCADAREYFYKGGLDLTQTISDKNHKDSCEKTWAQTICGRDQGPNDFLFP